MKESIQNRIKMIQAALDGGPTPPMPQEDTTDQVELQDCENNASAENKQPKPFEVQAEMAGSLENPVRFGRAWISH